jgi:precorrin-6B methylase 2
MDKFFILYEKIAVNFNILSSVYLTLYEDIVKNEILIANITEKDKILVIGGGTLPVTPALLVQNTNANIVSIDKDPEAVKYSKKFVENQKMNDKITVKLAHGEKFSINHYDVIIAVYGIRNASTVLQYLAENINQNTRLLFRTTYDIHTKSNIENIDLAELFDIVTHIRSAQLGQVDTFLLRKKS